MYIMRMADIQNKERTLKVVRKRNPITCWRKPIWNSAAFFNAALKDTQRLKVKCWKKNHLHVLHKQVFVSILISDKVNLKSKLEGMKKDIHTAKEIIYQEEITIVNTYAPQNGASTYTKQILLNVKNKIKYKMVILVTLHNFNSTG